MHCVTDARKGELCRILDAGEVVSMMQDEVKTLYLRCKRHGIFCIGEPRKVKCCVRISMIRTKIICKEDKILSKAKVYQEK